MNLSNIEDKDPEKLLEEILQDTDTEYPRDRKYVKCKTCGNWASLRHCKNKQLSQKTKRGLISYQPNTVGVKLNMRRPTNPVKTVYIKDVEKLKKQRHYYCSKKCMTAEQL